MNRRYAEKRAPEHQSPITSILVWWYLMLGILVTGVLVTGALSFASDCQWIETTGEAAVENITPEEARQLALNRAKVKAIESVSDVKVNAITLVKNLSMIADFIQALSSGYILEEQIINWKGSTYQEKKDSPPVTIYTVILKSCVAPTQAGDPYFKIKGELNRAFFISGEEARIKTTCTKDCYLTIVNLAADGRMKVLLPNEHEQTTLIKSGKTYEFPMQGLSLEMYPLKGHQKDTEAFLLIATKERFDLLPLLRKSLSRPEVEKGIEGRSREYIIPGDFYKSLLSLPADTRTEEILVYEVREK